MSAARVFVVLAVVLGLLPGLAGAATPDGGRLTGRLPDDAPVVSIDQPRGTVLDMVLEAGSLQASFGNGVLRVRSDATATSGEGWRERRRERRGRAGAERVVFGRSLTIEANETVDKAVAIGGSVTVAGHVRRDAV